MQLLGTLADICHFHVHTKQLQRPNSLLLWGSPHMYQPYMLQLYNLPAAQFTLKVLKHKRQVKIRTVPDFQHRQKTLCRTTKIYVNPGF